MVTTGPRVIGPVQNRCNVVDRSSEPMLDLCNQEMLVFIPWAPIEQTETIPALMAAARRRGVTERQVALAWLLTRSPQVLPIPGSGDPAHVEQTVNGIVRFQANGLPVVPLYCRVDPGAS